MQEKQIFVGFSFPLRYQNCKVLYFFLLFSPLLKARVDPFFFPSSFCLVSRMGLIRQDESLREHLSLSRRLFSSFFDVVLAFPLF